MSRIVFSNQLLGIGLVSLACLVSSPFVWAAENEAEKKLQLCGEMPLKELLDPVKPDPKKNKVLDLEASGVLKHSDHYYVVFDNIRKVAKIPVVDTGDLKQDCSEKFPGFKKGEWIGSFNDELPGFEGIAYDRDTERFIVAVESRAEGLGPKYNPWVEELTQESVLENVLKWTLNREQKLSDFPAQSANKGVEGLVWTNFGTVAGVEGKGLLLALCEGTKCGNNNGGRGLIRTFQRNNEQWVKVGDILLPENKAKFGDFSGLAITTEGEENKSLLKMAVVSQEDKKIWVGRISLAEWESTLGQNRDLDLAADQGEVYLFPKRRISKKEAEKFNLDQSKKYAVYCNVEGLAWVDRNILVAVSDRVKNKQKEKACPAGQMSIHMFRIPE